MQIAANTITAGKIAAGTITGTEIAASTITGSKIAAGTITAGLIAANTITANEIAANTITSAQIAANTITAGQIAAGAISADKISAGTINTTDNTFSITIGGATSTIPREGFSLLNGINITRKNSTASIISVSQVTVGFGYEIIQLGNTSWPAYNIAGSTRWFVADYRHVGLAGTGTVRKLPGYGLYINDDTYWGSNGGFSNFQSALEIYSKYGCTAKFESDARDYGVAGVQVVSISGAAEYGLFIVSNANRFTQAGLAVSNLGYPAATFEGGGTNTTVTITSISGNGQAGTGIGLAVTAGSYSYASVDITNNAGSSYPAINAVGTIRTSGNVIAYYSDDRLKTKLGIIQNSLEKLNTLSGFYYEPNELAQSLGYEKRREIGISAQDVQKVLPEIIHNAPIDNKYLTIDYERLIPLIIEAIKELDRRTK